MPFRRGEAGVWLETPVCTFDVENRSEKFLTCKALTFLGWNGRLASTQSGNDYMRTILFWLGTIGILLAVPNIIIRVAGSDQAVQMYAGGSRNLDTQILAVVVCLILLAIARILAVVEEINEKIDR